jgi:predicted dehydrogenase
MSQRTRRGVGLIGLGGISPAHLNWLTLAEGWDVVAICDVDPARVEKVAGERGITNAFTDAQELIDCAEVEIVDIATPPAPHAELARAAFGAGRHVMSEKPLVLRTSDAFALAEAAEKAGVVHGVCHEYRYHPAHRAVARLLAEGYVGELQHVSLDRTQALSNLSPANQWIRDPSVGGGFLMQTLVHHLDLILWLCGTFAITGAETAGHPQPGDAVRTPEDVVLLHGTAGDGALLSVTGGWSYQHPAGTRWQFNGSEGTLRLESDSYRTAEAGTRVYGARSGAPLALLSADERDRPPWFAPEQEQFATLFASQATEFLRKVNDVSFASSFATFSDSARLLKAIEPARPDWA